MKYTAFVELVNDADLAFVARAVSGDDNRPQFWNIKIEEKDGGLLATATDGRRLHKAQLDKRMASDVSPGYWRVLKNEKVKMRDYDLEDRLLPTDRLIYYRNNILWLARLESFDLFVTDEQINRINPQGDPVREGLVDTRKYQPGSINELIKNLPDNAGINPEYLKDLGPYEWHYKTFAADRPVLFECQNKTALIMPLDLS